MHSQQPTLRLGRDVWDPDRMPVEEFRGRADRLRDAMGQAGLDALLLYGRGLNDCGHPTYLSNYVVNLPFAALAVLPRQGDPALLFEGATRGKAAAGKTTWIEDVRPCWNLAEACLAVLEERRLASAAIGLAGMPRLVPFDQWQALASGLPRATLVEAEALVDRLRAVKSPHEIAQVQRASRIVDHALRSVTMVRQGRINEAALAAHVMREARLQGAEDLRLMIGRPSETEWMFRPPEDAVIESGETVYLLVAASRERYWSEGTRTFRLEGDELALIWDEELAIRFQRLVNGAGAGMPVAGFVAAARAAMSPSETTCIDVYGLGHGIGITPEEPPMLSAESGWTIERGMCLVIRAALEGRGGLVLHGETVIV